MTRTRIISIEVNKMVGDVFNTILELSPKIISDIKINSEGRLSFIGFCGEYLSKFNKNNSLGILNHQYVDKKSSWNIPLHVISNGDFSEIIIFLKQPTELSDLQFEQKINKISDMMTSMKHILESNV